MRELQHEQAGGEAGVQVPLLPDPGTGRPAEPDVRVGAAVQPGARGTVPGVDAGTAAGHVRRDVPDAHGVEDRPGYSVAVRGVQRGASAGPAASPARLRQLLGQAREVPGIQVEAKVEGVGDVHRVRVPLPGRPGLAGEAVRAAGDRVVPAAPEGAEPSTVTVSRDAACRWHISILAECPVETLPPATTAVGVDAGITSLVTLSTGEKVTNPGHERRDRARLAKTQRALSRTQNGSANRAKARMKVARVHARITDRRRDHGVIEYLTG